MLVLQEYRPFSAIAAERLHSCAENVSVIKLLVERVRDRCLVKLRDYRAGESVGGVCGAG